MNRSDEALTGTLPVRPFHRDGFYGVVQSDGQRPRLAACVVEPSGVTLCLSLVGPANSVSSALAKLMDPRGRLQFDPADHVPWDEPRILMRDPACTYRQIDARLRGTTEVHGLALANAAHLGEGLLHPPVLPTDPPKPALPDSPDDDLDADQPDQTVELRQALAQAPPRYLLGNADEPTPNRRAFLGVLRGLRAVFVNAPADASPALHAAMHQWADALWCAGLETGLIVPLPALGMRGWRVSGNLAEWSDLISAGVRQRWLSAPL